MASWSDFGIELPPGASGEGFRAICPQCSHTRKPQHRAEKELSVNVEEGTWLCHHCDWRGSLGSTAEREPPGYLKPDYEPLALPQKAMDWFASRGIGEDILRRARIGWDAGRKAIMFPRIKGGAVVAIKYRAAGKKFWQSKQPEPCFYNHDGARACGADTLVICEGEIDALSFEQAGVPNVVSVPDGAPSPNSRQHDKKFAFLDRERDFLARFSRFILAVDADEPGRFLEEILAERLGRHRCWRVTWPAGAKDANDVLVAHGPERLRQVILNARPCPIDGLYGVDDLEDAVYELYDTGLRRGLGTGWPCVDEFYTVRTCEMTIITGIPGSGKSTWLDALCVQLFREHAWRFAFCSPENWPLQRHCAGILEKIMLRPFGADTLTARRLSRREVAAGLDRMRGSFFFTQLKNDDMSISGILDVMRAAVSRHGVRGVILDPWNELENHRPPRQSETEFISDSLGRIRRFARMNDAHVWIVAHPVKLKRNEDGTYPVPRLYDISGSAHFYNKADNGISVYRKDPTRDETQIHIQKIRFREVGKLGCAHLRFSRDCGVYHCADGPAAPDYGDPTGNLDCVPF